MDDCSRQDPAYRPATESPREGGGFLFPGCGTQFDPGVVAALCQVVESVPVAGRRRVAPGRLGAWQSGAA